jgi:crossover junction endodeoxyribonuclease RusA
LRVHEQLALETPAAIPQRAPEAGEIVITVTGTPAPQGSKKGFVVGNRAVIVDDNKPKLRNWRADVKDAAAKALAARAPYVTEWQGAVGVEIEFRFARPLGHYRTGRNAHILRDTAPRHPQVKPDIDKTTRAVLDALKDAGAIRDDARVTDLHAIKRYCLRGQLPGATITIREIWEQEP